jgi:DNA-binding response OmpR family regulator
MMSTTHPTEETIRVLFIENDPGVAEMYKLKLELDGYQVSVVPNDERVLQEADSARPDLIFLDLRSGEDKGFAMLQQLRATASTRDVPVIILSKRAASEMAGQGFTTTVLDYVVRADPGPNDLSWNLQDLARAGSA